MVIRCWNDHLKPYMFQLGLPSVNLGDWWASGASPIFGIVATPLSLVHIIWGTVGIPTPPIVDLLAVNLRIVAQKISGKFSHHISFCIGGGGGKRVMPSSGLLLGHPRSIPQSHDEDSPCGP